MSIRGLTVAVLCGLLGVGGGVLVAYLAQPHPADAGTAAPLTGVSPSVPTYSPSIRPYAPDVSYPPLPVDLPLNQPHTIKNHRATWSYHTPQGWLAYDFNTNAVIPPKKIDQAKELRFRPPDEPDTGGYSLYIRVLDNAIDVNPEQMVATKIIGFNQAGYPDRVIVKKTSSSVYFTYRDPTTNYHRYNYFAWYAVPTDPNHTATLQVSVAGRAADAPGLRALMTRFADNLIGQ